MDATLILIDSDGELVRARALVDQLWNSNDPAERCRSDPPPHGSAQSHASGPISTLREWRMPERSIPRPGTDQVRAGRIV